MNKYIDFDRCIAEAKGETKTVKIFGHKYQVPSEMPAAYLLQALRRSGKILDDYELLEKMFGKEQFGRIISHSEFTAKMVPALIRAIWLEADTSADEPEGITEDSLAIEQTEDGKRKKA